MPPWCTPGTPTRPPSGGRAGPCHLDEVRGGSDRDREPEPLGVAGRRGVDPDDVAADVEQRTAAVAGVDRRIGLDQAGEGDLAAGLLIGDADLAIEAGDDAPGDRLGERAERAPDRDGGLADLEPV